MQSKLVFHIGSFKSGSTAIQSTLAARTYRCDSRNILYPGLNAKEGQEKARGQHGPLAETLFPAKPAHAKRQERFALVAEHIAAAGADINVISAEKFEYANPKLLAEAIRDYFPEFQDSLQIIVYVRPHAERVLAEFAERVKHGRFRGDLEELHARTKPFSGPLQRGFFYHPRLSLWREVFGESLTVRPMIRAHLHQSDVVADFFRQILDGADFSISEAPRKNISPSLEDLVAVRAFHQACGLRTLTPLQEKTGVQLIQAFSALPTQGATRLALHADLVRDIVQTYAGDAAALDRDFFTGDPMQEALAQAPEKAVKLPQSLEASQHLDAGQMRLLTAWVQIAAELTAETPSARRPQSHRPHTRS